MFSKFRVLVVILMFAVTWYALQFTSEVKRVPIKKSLSSFPLKLGEYVLSNAFQSSAEVIEMLGVDDYIQYNYIRNDGRRINLYVGYYEAVGVDGGYHSPKNCIPGGGWGIDRVEERILPLSVENVESPNISEMVIRRGGEYQVVFYWYQNRGRIIASEYWEKIYQVLDALLMGRRDGAFVRIMLSVPGNDVKNAESELEGFSELVLTQLKEHLPGATL